MTRQEITAQAVELANAYIQTPSEVSPILLNHFCNWTCEDLTRVVRNVPKVIITNLTDGESVYELPQSLLFLETVEARRNPDIDAEDHWITLLKYTSREFMQISWTYRTYPRVGEPIYAVMEGETRIRLCPTPNYTVAGGLRFRGIGTYDSTDWPSGSSPCPLPPRVHQTVVYGVAARICEKLKEEAGRAAYQQRYTYGKGQFEGEGQIFSEAQRSRYDPDFVAYGWGTDGNPMNW